MGPIGVAHSPFLPSSGLRPLEAIHAVSLRLGFGDILLISYGRHAGGEGMTNAPGHAILNTELHQKRLESHYACSLPNRTVAHEMTRPAQIQGVRRGRVDVAKR